MLADGTYRLTSAGTLDDANYRSGYLVAVEELASIAAICYPTNTLVGVWTDPKTGIIYLDRSVWVRCKFEALALAKSHSQLAIWDARNNVSIYV